jgi:N utilization substance protein A
MVPNELLGLVDTIHRDKNLHKEILFKALEAALVSAAKKHYGEEATIVVEIDRVTGSIRASRNGVPFDAAEIAERFGAQASKDMMIQKLRQAEQDAL